MRKELISEDELMSHLRQHGIEDIAEVKLCSLESDGHISVIERKTPRLTGARRVVGDVRSATNRSSRTGLRHGYGRRALDAPRATCSSERLKSPGLLDVAARAGLARR